MKNNTAQEVQQRSEALFRIIAENAGDLTLIVSYPELKAIYVSPTYEKLLGYSVAELQGGTPLALVHPDDVPIIQIGRASCRKRG